MKFCCYTADRIWVDAVAEAEAFCPFGVGRRTAETYLLEHVVLLLLLLLLVNLSVSHVLVELLLRKPHGGGRHLSPVKHRMAQW